MTAWSEQALSAPDTTVIETEIATAGAGPLILADALHEANLYETA
jgi:hypothetical protein